MDFSTFVILFICATFAMILVPLAIYFGVFLFSAYHLVANLFGLNFTAPARRVSR